VGVEHIRIAQQLLHPLDGEQDLDQAGGVI
jgi:hypothetical protein